jgi:hypothetical protein
MYPIGSIRVLTDLSDTAVIETNSFFLSPFQMPPFESPFANVTKLVWITPDAEQIIEHCARVSNPKAQDKVDTTGKLLRYLVTHKHWSPFEMASACVEITTTRDISAQILRHRSFSFQEFSQRYASTVDGLGGLEIPHLRRQDQKNRQSSHDDLSVYTRRPGTPPWPPSRAFSLRPPARVSNPCPAGPVQPNNPGHHWAASLLNRQLRKDGQAQV